MAKSIAYEFTKGLWNEVPPFRLVLGLCPVLGVTTTMKNGIGMGLATTFVLLCSNILVSLLRKVIPAKVRIACFIIIIATSIISPAMSRSARRAVRRPSPCRVRPLALLREPYGGS